MCNKDEMLKYQTTMLEDCYKPLLGVPPSATVSEIMLRLLLVLSESTSRCCCCCCCFSDLGFFFSPRFLLELDSLKKYFKLNYKKQKKYFTIIILETWRMMLDVFVERRWSCLLCFAYSWWSHHVVAFCCCYSSQHH